MTTTPIRSDWVGRVIDGRFTLLQWLGGSGSSGVFLTELEGHGSQKAALKFIAADAREAELYIASWTVTRPLSHPHLMRLFHTGRCEIDAAPLLFEVTEYAEENLAEILPERALTPTETGEMLDPVLDALSFLHEKGFVHGRLKPSNIMVVNDQVKLSRDRLFVSGEGGAHLPAAGPYNAPESMSGTITPAADVWSLGVIIVEALTQHPPVWDSSAQSEPVVPQSISQPFFGIAQECLRLDPARRCTLSEVKARLEPVQIQPVQAEKAGGTRSPRRTVTVLIVAAAVVLLAVIAALVLRSHETPTLVATEAQQPEPAHAKPSPQSPAPRIKAAKSAASTARGEVVEGSVAERVLPDVLPAATASIHGQFNLSIRVAVDSAGNVSKAEFDSPGPSKYFGRVAREAAQRWKFKPPQVGGQPVPSEWLLQFQFTQSGTEITPTEVSP